MSTKDQTQPLGRLVGAHPARRPERTTLRGRTVTLVPLDAATHADALFRGATANLCWRNAAAAARSPATPQNAVTELFCPPPVNVAVL